MTGSGHGGNGGHGGHGGAPAQPGRDAVRSKLARWWAAPRRPWWKWVAIALLLAATVTVTALYATTLARDIARHHWAAALDASREAVLAVVGWGAVIIVLSAGREPAVSDGPEQPADGTAAGAHPDESVVDTESVLNAQHRVHRLRARLAELAAARERAGSGADPDLDREVASTTARLERARQWLTSAQSALTVSGPGRPPPPRHPPRADSQSPPVQREHFPARHG